MRPRGQPTARDLGSRLEDEIARILEHRGFATETRIKMRGSRGPFNEIDIMARRGKMVNGGRVQNYAEPTRVAIKEMRDFISKLEDLDIPNGLFVASTGFPKMRQTGPKTAIIQG